MASRRAAPTEERLSLCAPANRRQGCPRGSIRLGPGQRFPCSWLAPRGREVLGCAPGVRCLRPPTKIDWLAVSVEATCGVREIRPRDGTPAGAWSVDTALLRPTKRRPAVDLRRAPPPVRLRRRPPSPSPQYCDASRGRLERTADCEQVAGPPFSGRGRPARAVTERLQEIACTRRSWDSMRARPTSQQKKRLRHRLSRARGSVGGAPGPAPARRAPSWHAVATGAAPGPFAQANRSSFAKCSTIPRRPAPPGRSRETPHAFGLGMLATTAAVRRGTRPVPQAPPAAMRIPRARFGQPPAPALALEAAERVTC